MTHYRLWGAALAAIMLSGCASSPKPPGYGVTASSTKPVSVSRAMSDAKLALPDQSYFHQQDPRWAEQQMGGSGEPLSSDGCLVTAAAMALSNLGFSTNPGDLNARLKAKEGFTPQGWLIWSGVERVTAGKAKARFFKNGTETDVRACMADGYYPLVKFKLPNRRSHWAMVVADSPRGFYVRDPMVNMQTPIPLAARAQGISSVRCIGLDA